MKNEKRKRNLTTGIVVSIILIIAIIIGIVLLNKNNNSSLKNIAGDYKMTSLTYEDGEEENVEKLEKLGFTVTLELKEDGTGLINIFGEMKEISYNSENMTIDGEILEYNFKNNSISMQIEGSNIILVKNQ